LTIGIYGAEPGLLFLNWHSAPRYFDGDKAKHCKYLPGCNNQIEPPERLIDNPVDRILIGPIHHDRSIYNYLINELHLDSSSIISIKDILTKV